MLVFEAAGAYRRGDRRLHTAATTTFQAALELEPRCRHSHSPSLTHCHHGMITDRHIGRGTYTHSFAHTNQGATVRVGSDTPGPGLRRRARGAGYYAPRPWMPNRSGPGRPGGLPFKGPRLRLGIQALRLPSTSLASSSYATNPCRASGLRGPQPSRCYSH
jgi:hypothetical protein